jgi:hypothetical protein
MEPQIVKVLKKDGAGNEAARKKAHREKLEAERLGRLERLRQLTSSTRTSPRWMQISGRWSWHEFSAERGAFVDTGIEPVPGVPLPQQRPEGR